MAKVTVLDLVVTGDATDAERAFDAVGASAKAMGDDVKTASRDIDTSTSRIDGAADASDNLASKSSQATGGLGALSAGFELVGAEKYAVGLQSAAMATDFFSGVGDIANLVLQSSVVLKIKDAAATAAKKTAEIAGAAATKAMAATQWLLNAALTANPIGIVVVALVALVAGLVIAYKKSDAFRAIVQKGMGVVVRVFDNVVQAVGRVVGWVKDKLPAAGRIAKTLIVTYFKAMILGPLLMVKGVQLLYGWAKDKIPAAFAYARDRVAAVVAGIRDRIATIIDKARDVVSWVRGNLAAGFTAARDKIKAPIEVVTGYIDDLLQTVKDLVGWIADIDFPSPPKWLTGIDVNPFSKTGSTSAGAGSSGGDTKVVNIDMRGGIITDPIATAKAIVDLLRRYGYAVGDIQGMPV